MSESLPRLLLFSHLAVTLFMLGVIWFVQVVHYPLFAKTGSADFCGYEQPHTALTTWVVAPPMLWEGMTAWLLFWFKPTGVSTWQLAIGLALLVVIWLSTALVQVPCHNLLSQGFDSVVQSATRLDELGSDCGLEPARAAGFMDGNVFTYLR